MIKSMTGFGRSEVEKDNRKFIVELKSVNHRYLDTNFRMPKKLNFFENQIRTVMKRFVSRGKIDVYISYEDANEKQSQVKYNDGIAKEYLTYLKMMEEQFGLENDIRVSSLSRYPEVLTLEEQSLDQDELWAILKRALEEALTSLVQTRVLEGENLKADILTKLEDMTGYIHYIETRSPSIQEEYRTRLQDKVTELLGNTQLDENRIATEVVIFADKICTDEELVRLQSHISHMKDTLIEKDGVGRKLDFIAQEMNREANTILSKANDLDVSNQAISLKTEIEKIREQIQNIE